jgi:hypothetical protein
VDVLPLLTSEARKEVFWSLAVSVIVLLMRRLLVRVFSGTWIVDSLLS